MSFAARVELLTAQSRVVVTGQIGCGKTTFAAAMSAEVPLRHVHLDEFNGRSDPHSDASALVLGLDGGWVVDGCVWQVPTNVWSSATLAVFLDYPNWLHYARIARRAIRRCVTRPAPSQVRHALTEEYGHFQIMYRHADENRRSWARAGGITAVDLPVIRCSTPAEAAAAFRQLTGRR